MNQEHLVSTSGTVAAAVGAGRLLRKAVGTQEAGAVVLGSLNLVCNGEKGDAISDLHCDSFSLMFRLELKIRLKQKERI